MSYFDLDVSNNGKILDIEAVDQNGDTFYSTVSSEFLEFISSAEYLYGHNIVSHDIKYIKLLLKKSYKLIETLYLTPILFQKSHCIISILLTILSASSTGRKTSHGWHQS